MILGEQDNVLEPGRGRKCIATKIVDDVATQVGKRNRKPPSTLVFDVLQHHLNNLVPRFVRFFGKYFAILSLYTAALVLQHFPDDPDSRQTFALLFLARVGNQDECPWNILWTEEAHFHMEGPVACFVTGQRYASSLEQFVILAFQARRCGTTTVFIQEGAPPHIPRCLKQVLRHPFGDDGPASNYSLAF
ncbi:transposable element tc3 transposase [Trichonephila clavipes]|nr:transposable element tc3 transposase [Trichonephila clavipes]